jgi:catechol 2,3-dioxygenase-like lactoylglutathione lyase family enzyme
MTAPECRLSSVVLSTADPRGLAAFYRELLAWEVRSEHPEWVVIEPPDGTTRLSFQLEDGHVPPTWPSGPGAQQMQLHLDIAVDDLDAGVARAKALGAGLAAFQPQDDVRVMIDPAGHPFCLFAPVH